MPNDIAFGDQWREQLPPLTVLRVRDPKCDKAIQAFAIPEYEAKTANTNEHALEADLSKLVAAVEDSWGQDAAAASGYQSLSLWVDLIDWFSQHPLTPPPLRDGKAPPPPAVGAARTGQRTGQEDCSTGRGFASRRCPDGSWSSPPLCCSHPVAACRHGPDSRGGWGRATALTTQVGGLRGASRAGAVQADAAELAVLVLTGDLQYGHEYL